MPSSSVFKQTEDLLEDVLRMIREEYESPSHVLSETDRNMFVEDEEDLRKRLKETVESESGSSLWRNWIGLPSPRAAKCLKDAEELRQRVSEDINAKVRTRLMGRSSPPSSASHDRGSASDLMGASTPEADTGRPRVDPDFEPASAAITSPLNMCCSVPEISELIVYPVVHDYAPHLNEAINTPLEMSSDRSRESSSRRQRRRTPPPRPAPRTVRSSNLHISSETTGNLGSSSPRRSHSVRRPPPPPPPQSPRQSRTASSPVNGSFPLPGPLSPNLTTMSSISEQVNNLVSSIIRESLPGLAPQGQWDPRHHAANGNYVDISGQNVNAEGVTVSNGGSNNSGAVIHKTMLPQPVSQA